MKSKRSGLTIVELLTVAAIIALLVGLLIPALGTVRRIAKETKQKAQFVTISLALTTFKNDYGDYPPSDWTPQPLTGDYCGPQKLAEALLGWDLMGFHPDSHWQASGRNVVPYWDRGVQHAPDAYFFYDPASAYDMDKRKGRYLEIATANAFRLGTSAPGARDGLFDDTGPLAPDRFVICDAFGTRRVALQDGTMVKAGLPILYYKANSPQKTIRGIYDVFDDDGVVLAKEQDDHMKHPGAAAGWIFNPLGTPANAYEFFYGTADPTDGVLGYIQDPKVMGRPWPYRPDSYLLISAGADGFYGTDDDIRNFGN